MEALLPSEIARLVFGYLEDQKCDIAARSFLEASSHLEECRTAVLSGRRFNTRVNGYTLVDIFDKFSAAQCLVHEKLSRVEDSEHVRQCGDLLEQLRFLIGGSRGQRFVVNINVPSQANPQSYAGSPIITSSIRKRHRSGSDRDRTKRTQKPLHPLLDNKVEPVSSQLGCVTVEATPLESLPGHTNLSISRQHSHATTEDSDHVYCASNKSGFVDCPLLGDLQSVSKQICDQPSLSHEGNGHDNSSGRLEGCSPVSIHREEKIDRIYMDDEESRNSLTRGKTMATSTDELTTYSSIEVQTTPYALSESESIGLDDEPIENLSLLTKELLNRTELQERIAENINKAILPLEMPSKDDSICESISGELNTSIMAELNNAIKSIVAATETDPIFEHFLDEIIGPNMDTDTSPDEEPDVRVTPHPPTNSRINNNLPKTDVVNMDMEEVATVTANTIQNSIDSTEVPLKQRLRSSSKQQNTKAEDEGNKPEEVDTEDISLADHNAAAIMSIINANIVSEKQVIDNATFSGNKMIGKKPAVINSTEMLEASQAVESAEVVEHYRTSCRSVEVPCSKKSVSTKSNPEADVDQQELITEQEMMAMPTLIVCSQEEMRDCNHAGAFDSSVTTVTLPEARFVAIAPKGPEVMKPLKPIYLRAVHVPVQVPDKIQAASGATEVKLIGIKPRSPPKISSTKRKRNHRVSKKSKNLKPVVIETNSPVNSESPPVKNNATSRSKSESITLYANDNSFGAMIESGHMPAINLEDSMTLTDTGLSPYLKFHNDKCLTQQSALLCEKPPNQVPSAGLGTVPIVLGHDDSILITRRTPRSLLKSRSKHNRISMSTPRRRSSHIRALDFNTPTKSSTSEHKLGRVNSLQFSSKSSKSSKRARSVCRTSLFKSPLFSNSIIVAPRGRTPEKDCQSYKIPIATRSPAPKLMGGWEKYTGVEMILGGTSPHPSSSALMFGQEELKSPIEATSASCPTLKKSWDADLREALQEYQAPAYTTLVTTKEMARNKAEVKNCGTDLVKHVSESGDTKIGCDPSEHIKISHLQETEQAASQGACEKIDNGQWESILSTPSEAKRDLDKLKQVELSPVVDNLELGVSDRAQIVDIEIQGKLASTDMKDHSGNDTELQVDVTPKIKGMKKITEKPEVKKYAKIKTLESKLSQSKKGRITRSNDPCVVDYSQKKCEYSKVSPESRSLEVHLSCMIDLETPRKTDNVTGIPPTPRLLSPSSNTITPFAKVPEGVSRVPSFVNTPDFPPTPSIALTPNVMGENTIDAIKKREYSTGSPYYEPSTERPDILEKLIDDPNNLEKHVTGLLPVTLPVDIDTGAVTKSGGDASDFVMTVPNSILEITQFEVIKENLPKEATVKQLKISAHPTNVQDTSSAITELGEISQVGNISKSSPIDENNGSSSGNESSDSTSSDSSSTSSCSTTCSCSNITTTSTPLKFQNRSKTKSNVHRDNRNDCTSKSSLAIATQDNLLTEISPIIASEICNASKNNQTLIAMQIPSSVLQGEISPVKLLPLIKSLEEVDASVKETPAKDEALLSEANISETPSSSKSGIESLTNLNSKISALDSPGDQDGNLGHSHSENKIQVAVPSSPKPEVLGAQHLLPDVSVALKPSAVSEMVSRTAPPFNNLSMLSSVALDGKLGTHLEEKRLRLMAKMKNKPQPKLISQRTKVKQLNFNVTKHYKDKNDMLKSSTRQQKICTNQAACRNSTMKKVHLGPEKKLVSDKNAEIKMKQISKSISHGNEKDEISNCKVNLVGMSSKETKYDECNTTQSAVKPTSINRPQTPEVRKEDDIESSNGNKITRVDDQQDIHNPKEHSCADSLVAQLCSKDCTMRSVDSTETVADLDAIHKMMNSTHATEPTSSLSQKCDPAFATVDTTGHIKTVDKEFTRSLVRRSEDEELGVENVMNPVKKSQIVPMCKVDLIKRDLFSDEENSDQRTTRSKARQLSDAQKNEPVMKVSESAAQSRAGVYQVVAKKSREELASVLECLKLVPAIKYDVAEKSSSSLKPIMNKIAEYEFVYDDSLRVKKKTIKFGSRDLRYRINVELRDDNYRECSKLMTPTAYAEIFNISPKSKKRVIAKKLLMKNPKPTKVEAVETTSNSGKILKSAVIKPVDAAPAASTMKLKTPISKGGKIISQLQPEGIVNLSCKDDNKKSQDINQMLKKRKMNDTEKDHSGDKKRCIADPQTLLKKLNLDLFLNTVHGPV